MEKKIRVMQFGIGVIGRSVTKYLLEKKNLEIVGAIDLNHKGEDLGELAGIGHKLGVTISNDLYGVLKKSKPQVAIHTTCSSFKKVLPELEALIKGKVNVVSSCEELSYPFYKHPKLAARLDELAKDYRVTVLGTGVNPGFLMDAWPLFMSSVCTEVKEIRVNRVQDASLRRLPFQEKIGAGKSPEEFAKLAKEGILRHVGLTESIAMIAAGLGWRLDKITETIEPIFFPHEVKSEYITVLPGQAAGVRQVGCGWKKGTVVITLNFEAAIGLQESFDSVAIIGNPQLEVVVKGGTHGDTATVAMLVNAIPKVISAPPGLKTMKDFISSYWSGA